ncbi:hypothetical protein TrLO_g15488, partial [Triparma laevis f. longispina]
MAELLMSWLNDELKMSKRVTNLDTEFANGYLIGEILFKHNQQADFGQFNKKQTPDAKIQNFCMIEPTLKRLNIKFDAKVAYGIMQNDQSKTSKLIYQLKMCMDRLEKFSAPTSIRGVDEKSGKKPLPNIPVRPSHSKFNEKSHAMFDKSIRQMIEGGNNVMMDTQLKRFKDEEEKQMRDMEQFKHDTNAAAVQKIIDIKAQRMSQKKEAADIQGAKNQENLETWERNQALARERKNVKKRVEKKLQAKKEELMVGMKMNDKASVVDQIRDFEHRLSRMDKPPPVAASSRISNNDPNALVSDKRGMEKDVAKQMKTISTRKKLTEEKSLAREKRRRRFIKNQEEAQIEGYNELGTEMIREQLTRLTVQENSTGEDIKTIGKHTQMATENRTFRLSQYKARGEVDTEVALSRDNSFLDSSKITMNAEISAQHVRLAAAKTASVCTEKKRTEMLVEDTLESLIDLAMVVADYREYAKHYEYNISDEDPAPLEVWSDLKRAYTNVQILPKFTVPTTDTRVWGVTSTSPEDAVADVIDSAEYKEYISNASMWSKFVYKLPEAEEVAGAEATALGDLVISTSLTAKPFDEPAPAPVIPNFPLKIALYGVSFSGKTEQASRLGERYALKVVSVDAELGAACEFSGKVQLGVVEEPAEGSLEHEFLLLGREANAALVLGGEVGDELYVGLAVAAIKRLAEENKSGEEEDECLGWICEDFPQTTKQAILFEKALTGYDFEAHVDHIYDRKSELAAPSARVDPDFEVIRGGVDMVFNLKNEVDVTLKRSLGRRVDPVTEERYHLETARPPFDLICKERLVEPEDSENATDNLSLHVLTHERGVDGAEEFFRKFDNLVGVGTDGLTTDGVFAVISKHIDGFLSAENMKREKAAEEKAARVAEEEAKLKEEEELKRIEEEKAAMKEEDGGEGEGEGVVEPEPEPEPEAEAEEEKVKESVVGTLSQDLGAILDLRFGAASTQYSWLVQRTLRSLREERVQLAQHLHDIRAAFHEMLVCVDNKQPVVSGFVKAFNEVDTDMRFDARTKAELVLRIEEMRDTLWTLIETRKAEVDMRLKETREDGWVEKRDHALKGNFGFLMQLEVDRFFHGVELLMDGVSAVTGQVPLEATEGVLKGIGDDAEEEVGDAKGGGKGGKKDDKKKGKGDKGAVEEVVVKPAERSKVPPVVFVSLPLVIKTAGEEEEPVVENKKAKKGKKGATEVEEVKVEDMLLGAFEAATGYADSFGSEALKLEGLEDLEEGESHPASLLADREKIGEVYKAIWYEAAQLKARLQRLYDAGLAASQKVQGLALKCYDEIEVGVGLRIKGEFEAVEKLVVAANGKVVAEESIEYYWSLQSLEFKIWEDKRVLPVPVVRDAPVVVDYGYSSFNEGQLKELVEGLDGLDTVDVGGVEEEGEEG